MPLENYEEEVDLDKYRAQVKANGAPEDDIEIDIEGADDDAPPEIEIIDDRAPDDRGKKNAHQIANQDFDDSDLPLPGDDPDERAQYVQRAQQRLKETTFRYHAERRSREEAERQAAAALELSRSYIGQIQQLQTGYKENETFAVGELKARAEQNIALLGDQLRKAHMEADAEAIVKVQQQMNNAQLQLAQLQAYRPAEFRAPNPEQDYAAIAPRVTAPAAPQVDEATQRWSQRNPWFQTVPEMEQFARAVDRELTARNVNPLTDAKTYFNTIDREMRHRFPNYPWLDTQRASPPPVVTANATRTTPRTRGKVTLSRSQVDVARRLGITPAQYAQQVAKLKRGDNQ